MKHFFYDYIPVFSRPQWEKEWREVAHLGKGPVLIPVYRDTYVEGASPLYYIDDRQQGRDDLAYCRGMICKSGCLQKDNVRG